MKITGYQATTLNVPEDDPLANMPEEAGRTRPIIILRLRTDAGIEGIGVTLWGGKMTRQPARRGGGACRAHRRRGSAADREDHRQARGRHRRCLRAGRHLHAGAGGHRRGAVGHQGQGAGAAAVEAAGRSPRPRADLRLGLAAARADARPGAEGGAHPGREGLHGDEDADGAARQSAAGRGDPPRARGARGDRPGHQADVRHQPALAAGAGNRYRPAASRMSACSGWRT